MRSVFFQASCLSSKLTSAHRSACFFFLRGLSSTPAQTDAKSKAFLKLLERKETTVDQVKHELKKDPTLCEAQHGEGDQKNAKTRGNTALHVALEYARPDLAKVLIENEKHAREPLLTKKNAIEIPAWANALLYFHARNSAKDKDSFNIIKNKISKLMAKDKGLIFPKITKEVDGCIFKSCDEEMKAIVTGFIKFISDRPKVKYWPLQTKADKVALKKDSLGCGLLHYAIAANQVEIVKQILEDIEPDEFTRRIFASDNLGNNSLHFAVLNSVELETGDHDNSVLRLLLDKVAKQDEDGKGSQLSLMRYLYSQNKYGYDPFFVALSFPFRDKRVFQILFEYGYDIYRPNFISPRRDTDAKGKDIEIAYELPSIFMPLSWGQSAAQTSQASEWLFRHGDDLGAPVHVKALKESSMKETAKEIENETRRSKTNIWECLGHVTEENVNAINFLRGIQPFKLADDNKDSKKRADWLENLTAETVPQDWLEKLYQWEDEIQCEARKEIFGFYLDNEEEKEIWENPAAHRRYIFFLSIIHGDYTTSKKLLESDCYGEELLTSTVCINYSDRVTRYTPFHMAVIHGQDTGNFSAFLPERRGKKKMVFDLLIDALTNFVRCDDPSKTLNILKSTIFKPLEVCDKESVSMLNKSPLEEKKSQPVRMGNSAFSLAARHNYAYAFERFCELLSVYVGNDIFKVAYYFSDTNAGVKADSLKLYDDLRDGRDGTEDPIARSIEEVVMHNNIAIMRYICGFQHGQKLFMKYLDAMTVVEKDKNALGVRTVNRLLAQIVPVTPGYNGYKKPDSPTSLVFQGGGVRGIAYYGAVNYLVEKGVIELEKVSQVGGASAGAIASVLLAVGYTPGEMRTKMDDITMGVLFEKEDDIKASVETLTDLYMGLKNNKGNQKSMLTELFKAKMWLATIKLLYRLKAKKYIIEAAKLNDTFDEWIENKVKIKHCTFRELHHLRIAGYHNKNIKDLYIVAINENTRTTEVFSWLHTPDLIISDAVRCSMAIPVIFMSHGYFVKTFQESGQNGKETRDRRALNLPDSDRPLRYIDGGFFDNYPDWLFQESRDELLGFRLLNPKLFRAYSDGKHLSPPGGSSFFGYVSSLFQSLVFTKQESDFLKHADRRKVVTIDTRKVSTIDFDILDGDSGKKEELIKHGKDGAREYVNDWAPLFWSRDKKDSTSSTAAGNDEGKAHPSVHNVKR